MPHLPPELLLPILYQVRDAGDTSAHLDLLSCSLVCSSWFHCAFSLVAQAFSVYPSSDVEGYSNGHLKRLADIAGESRRYGLPHVTAFSSVDITVNEKLFEPTMRTGLLSQSCRADIIAQLVGNLQPPMTTIELELGNQSDYDNTLKMQNFLSKLEPNLISIRTLLVSGLVPFENKLNLLGVQINPRKHPIYSIIHNLRHQLQDIKLAKAHFPPAFIRTLSSCPNIRTACILINSSNTTPEDLVVAIASWPNLRELAIGEFYRGTPVDLVPMLSQLALAPPKHLESLELDLHGCAAHSQLHAAVTGLAPVLVRFKPPGLSTETGDEFLAFLAGIELPRLQQLDLSLVGGSLLFNGVLREQPDGSMALGLPWPELRRLSLKLFYYIHFAFIRLVITSCPAFEGLRFSGRGPSLNYIGLNEVEAWLLLVGWVKTTDSGVITFSSTADMVWEDEYYRKMNVRRQSKLLRSCAYGLVVVR